MKEHLKFLTVDECLADGIGDLVHERVRKLLGSSYSKSEQANEDRKKALKAKLAAFRAKQRQRHSLVLKEGLKSLWDVASNRLRKDLQDKGLRVRDDPVARRRRMGRGVEFERIDEYKEDGEPDIETQDRKRRKIIQERTHSG